MTSIDEIFKNSGLPSKRKLDPVRDPTQVYKSAKLSNGGPSRHAHVQDEPADDDVEAGPAPPPEGDDDGDFGPSLPPGEDDDPGEDEEGRFFGGGITRQEAEILDFIDSADNPAATAPTDEVLDAAWLKRTALSFERRISRNAELRARHEDDPARFIDSEADLDASIRALSILSEHPELYPEFARLGCAASLASLLAHDNTDIAIGAVEIIGELTDDDVAASDGQWAALVDALLEADLLSLLASNLSRLDETQEADREGVYRALGVVENLCSRRETAEAIGKDKTLVSWLLARAARSETPVTQNKQYAAEILAILAQSAPANRGRLAAADAVDALLQLIAPYRRRDPEKGGDEEEYVENVFEALSSLADDPEGKAKFVEAEGVELCLLILRDGGKIARTSSLRLLDHAAAISVDPEGASAVCCRIVEAGGLKQIFTLFAKNKKDTRVTEHLLGIFASMLRLLPGDSPERVRALAKFVEKEYEKTEKLVRLRREFASRVAAVDAQIADDGAGMGDEEKEDMAADWLSRRLDAGLFCLQTVDVILAWLVAEDDGARKKIVELLGDRDETLDVIRGTIQEQIEGVDEDSEEGRETKEMLTTLASFLQ